MKRSRLIGACLLVLIAAAATRVCEAQATWNGSQDGSWANQLNWSGTSAANLVNGGTSAITFAGTTQLSTTNTLANFLATTLTFNAGSGNFTLSGSAIRVNGGVTNSATGGIQTINLPISLIGNTRAFNAVASATTAYTGAMTGSGGVSYGNNATGVHVVSGSNSYTGSTRLSSSILVVSHVKALASGTFEFGGGVLQSTVDLTAGNRLTNASVGFNGGTGGAQTAKVAGANSIEFAAGLIGTGSGGSCTIDNNLDAGKSLTFGGLTLTNNAAAVAAAGMVVTGSGRTVISGAVIDGAAATRPLTKTGLGSLVLQGANTYTGTTTVTAGSLFVNGDSSAASGIMTVSSTAMLGGMGTIGGATTVSGTLTPGADAASSGLLSFAGSLSLGAASRTLIALDAGSRGSGYDAINVGGVAYGGTLDFTFASLVSGSFNIFGDGLSALTQSGNFAGITSSGAYGSPTWSRAGTLWTATADGGTTLTFEQTNGVLVVVPEPSAYLLACLGIAGCGWVLRRRRGFRSLQA